MNIKIVIISVLCLGAKINFATTPPPSVAITIASCQILNERLRAIGFIALAEQTKLDETLGARTKTIEQINTHLDQAINTFLESRPPIVKTYLEIMKDEIIKAIIKPQ